MRPDTDMKEIDVVFKFDRGVSKSVKMEEKDEMYSLPRRSSILRNPTLFVEKDS